MHSRKIIYTSASLYIDSRDQSESDERRKTCEVMSIKGDDYCESQI